MKWLRDLSIRAKLILGFGSVWIILAAIVFGSYLVMTGITASSRDLIDVHYEIVFNLEKLSSTMNYNRGKILEMMITTDKAAQDAIEKDIESSSKVYDDIIASLRRLDSEQTFHAGIAELEELRTAYRQVRSEEISLIRSGRLDEAKRLGKGEQEERFKKIASIVAELEVKASDDAKRQLAADMLETQNAVFLFISIGVAAFALEALIVLAMNKSIAKPLGELNAVAEAIASGDLGRDPTITARKDEIGILASTFSRMTLALRNIAEVAERIAEGDLRASISPQSENDQLGGSLAKMADSLHHSTADLSEAVNLLGSSASQILAATTQVASGTAETAAAISQTTATVEEVRQAAQLSSNKAKNMSDSAQRVAEVSQSGQKAVEDTAAGMLSIRDQMGSIAQTIGQLSEQGQSIGGIVSSVTDLADQSNLLAVNAAIEAARAGEQGKGFAVVAQEIRNLAEQSKQATIQIRDILNELQKATSAAVMATEQGSKAVESGVRQSKLSGEAIRALSESIVGAAQAAVQIVASSQQQVIGMDQIGIAMENINQAGAETAASMRQAQTAAQSLNELGLNLRKMVDHYKT